MQLSLKAVLLWYAQNTSASHMVNLYRRFVHFVRFSAMEKRDVIDEITALDLLNYKASLSSKQAWYLGTLSVILKKWHRLGLTGVSDDSVRLLSQLRIRGNAKGVAVLTMNVSTGPFSNTEQESIQSSLDSAYASGSISEEKYLLVWLFMALGQRPVQYAALKVCDVLTEDLNGTVEYSVKIPRGKQRNAQVRSEFKNRPLISQIGKPLFDYANRVRNKFIGKISDPSDAPLFPQRSHNRVAPGYEFHQTGQNIGSVLTYQLKKLKVHSERTGKLLCVTPVRFRRTFGTRAAQEGHGELVIADLLDHSDTQNVGVYVAAIPEIATRIDRAVAMQMAPLAQAFKGVLINDESQATRGGDPSSRIIDLRIDQSQMPMGSCGQHSYCGFAAPLACYTCKNFEPWLDGPHEAVLSHLLAKRDQLLVSTDQRIASVNDRTILAVAQVIQLCREVQPNVALTNG